jgi:hypothetical protein
MIGKDLGENAGVIVPSVIVGPEFSRKTVIQGIKYSSAYTYASSLFHFLWVAGVSTDHDNFLVSILPDKREITITGKDFITNYIPGTSAATFKLQADTDLITDDIENLWFTGSVQNDTMVSDLIGGVYHTLVWYSNSFPYNIYAIGILKNGVILTAAQINLLHTDFLLWMFWSGLLNNYGYLKNNAIMNIGLGIGPGFTGGRYVVSYDTATTALLARFSTPATAPLAAAIDTLILGLKAGVHHAGGTWWDKIDCLQKYNMLAVDQCLPNWKGNVWNATLVNSPVFTAKTGIVGSVTPVRCINTGFKPSDGVNFLQNDASWFCGYVTCPDTGRFEGAYNTAPAFYACHTRPDGAFDRFNSATENATPRAKTAGTYNILTRSAASVSRIYNGVGWYASNTTSDGRTTATMHAVGCDQDGVITGSINSSQGHLFGAYFTDTECDSIRVLLEAFDATVAAL